MKKLFISDCEGPISKNDNAFELASHFIPNGDKLFTIISKYDDVLSDNLKRPGYKAGDTLKLILPFLKAHGVTDQKMQEFSSQNLVLIPNVKETLRYIQNIAHAFIVSTSYEHYIKSLCQAINFPYENTYCTKVKIDNYRLTSKEKNRLKEMAREISQMSMIEIPPEAKSLNDFAEEHRRTIMRLDEVFWKEIANMNIGKIFNDVNPIGGYEKAEAIKNVAKGLGLSLENVMYVGDSITDVEAFKLVKENGGLTVSFNGNHYAVENSEIAVLAENSIITSIIADTFIRLGKQETVNLVKNWSLKTLKESYVNPTLLKRLFELYPKKLPKVKIVTSENKEILAKESSEFRKKVRGEALGSLG